MTLDCTAAYITPVFCFHSVLLLFAGYLWISLDHGISWNAMTSAGSRSWAALSTSGDCEVVAAVVYGEGIYTSFDQGATWTFATPNTTTQTQDWSSIAVSTDGYTFLASNYMGYLYTGDGYNWTEQTNSNMSYWISVATSHSGSVMAAADFAGRIFF